MIGRLQAAKDIKVLRAEFSLLSEELGVLIKTFGFGDVGPVFELHCPMAFNNRGASWLQGNDQPRNPYFGSPMLKCADRVEEIRFEAAAEQESPGDPGHSHH